MLHLTRVRALHVPKVSTSLHCVSGFVAHVLATFSWLLITFNTSSDHLFRYFNEAAKNVKKVNEEIDLSYIDTVTTFSKCAILKQEVALFTVEREKLI